MKIILFHILLLFLQTATGQGTNGTAVKHFKRINFEPTIFYRDYYSGTAPVLTINPGDTVSTESIDAGGYDEKGLKVSERGNPLTGPFFIEGAAPGDAIAVTITKLSLNRNYATTLEALTPRSLPGKDAKQKWRTAKLVKWNLDLENNIATPVNKHEHLQDFKIPLHPFWGCVGVAPAGVKKIPTGASGVYGGNLDFKFITQSATVYLPVYHSGALLFMGDGHAVQGDGELNGDALETSMSFEFTVRVIKNGAAELQHPRAEDSNYIMAFGIEKNLDEALKTATQNLLNWLQKDYQLSYIEATQVIGTSVNYFIPKIAATIVEIAAMIPKKILEPLKNITEE
ncbi:MAG: acetamidase/formamidase family protein [Chitinophagaceae bacterium]|nr:acetamidase/formamidase family protein [Chitinophagaceae bacterium]